MVFLWAGTLFFFAKHNLFIEFTIELMELTPLINAALESL